MSNNKKVLIIGLDGGTWDILNPMMRNGVMPHLKRIVAQATKGILQSIFPPATSSAWSSFMTGKNPGKHSVMDFFTFSSGKFKCRVVNSHDVMSKLLWSVLEENGKRMGIINVPMTYPPIKINGFMISGFLTPHVDSGICYPPSLYRELRTQLGEYIIPILYGKKGLELIQEIIQSHRQREKYILHLIEKYPWDFFIAVFSGTDWLAHSFWHYLDTSWLGNRDSSISTALYEYFHRLDETIGKMYGYVDKETLFLIISDHGFGSFQKKICMNKWLHREGFLKINRRALCFLEGLNVARELSKLANKIVNADFIKAKLVGRLQRRIPLKAKDLSQQFFKNIEWGKTYAYVFSYGTQGIYINLKGREPEGIVSRGKEYETIREEIIHRLKEFLDPDDGKPVASHIYRKEEIYHGHFLDNAPDILYILREGAYKGTSELSGRLFREVDIESGSGMHRMEGIFVASGRNIKKISAYEGANIMDIFPTVLYYMDLPIPEDIDGRPLMDIFTPSFRRYQPVRIQKIKEEFVAEREKELLQPEEEEQIKRRLKHLGYID